MGADFILHPVYRHIACILVALRSNCVRACRMQSYPYMTSYKSNLTRPDLYLFGYYNIITLFYGSFILQYIYIVLLVCARAKCDTLNKYIFST